ncbi:MAG TPA: hypothetical protein VD994_17920, partial [Prosthecobacter sp.]|nr:hypothetical protein [Prosthecobacter sp.]
NGSFSVKLISALPNSAAKAASASYAATGFLAATAPQLSVPVGGQTLALTFDTGTGLVTGTLGAAAVTGWRNVWNAQLNPADSLQGYYSFALDLADQADSGVLTIPQGTGFATFSVNASGGLAIAGKTADGETITTATFLGPNGQFWLYTPLYKNLGSLQGLLNVTEDSEGLFAGNNISGALTWFKPAAPTSRAYPGTFGPINLLAEGAYLAPASKGNIVLGLPEAGPVNLSFTDGGLANSVTDPDTTFTYTHDNKVVLSAAAANPGKIAITINAATGAVSGNFSLEETAPPLKRAKVPFHGQVVRLANGSVKAAGYFMLGQIPGQGETAAKAPLLSGGFSLWQTVD